mgnify:CR=1 FL=1
MCVCLWVYGFVVCVCGGGRGTGAGVGVQGQGQGLGGCGGGLVEEPGRQAAGRQLHAQAHVQAQLVESCPGTGVSGPVCGGEGLFSAFPVRRDFRDRGLRGLSVANAALSPAVPPPVYACLCACVHVSVTGTDPPSPRPPPGPPQGFPRAAAVAPGCGGRGGAAALPTPLQPRRVHAHHG